jgi:hypothetical protein
MLLNICGLSTFALPRRFFGISLCEVVIALAQQVAQLVVGQLHPKKVAEESLYLLPECFFLCIVMLSEACSFNFAVLEFCCTFAASLRAEILHIFQIASREEIVLHFDFLPDFFRQVANSLTFLLNVLPLFQSIKSPHALREQQHQI